MSGSAGARRARDAHAIQLGYAPATTGVQLDRRARGARGVDVGRRCRSARSIQSAGALATPAASSSTGAVATPGSGPAGAVSSALAVTTYGTGTRERAAHTLPSRPRCGSVYAMVFSFVVLAALREETEAILRCIEHRPMARTSTVFGACFELDLGDPHDSARRHGILVQLTGTGRVNAAVSTVHAIHTWNPCLILVAGTAGGFQDRNVALGDVIVAREVLDYEAQRLDGGSTVRWVDYEPDASLYALAKSIRLPQTLGNHSQVRFGSILSGDKVLASKAAVERFLALREDALGVEMEGAGVAFASAKSDVPWLMIRGIADFADDNKHKDAKQWTTVACDSVARFVHTLLERWADEASMNARAKQ